MTPEDVAFVRFHMQNWLQLGIAENDYARIADILRIPAAEVSALCAAYDAENRAVGDSLPKGAVPPLIRSVRVAFIGDSITSDRTSYLRILRETLRERADITLCNCAVSAWKSVDVVQAFGESVRPYRPNAAVVMIGANDMLGFRDRPADTVVSLSEYRRNLQLIGEFLRAEGAAAVFNTIPPVLPTRTAVQIPSDHWAFYGAHVRACNTVIRDVCRDEGGTLNDMEAAFEQEKERFLDADGLHLSLAGQAETAARTLAALGAHLCRHGFCA